MVTPAPRWITAALVALVAAVAAHVAIVVVHEPFAFDAWNVAAATKDAPAFSFANWADYNWTQYTTGNPRLGQTLAYLGYKVPWTTTVLTPLAWLAFLGAVVALGLGRLPSPRRTLDVALVAFTLGVAWLVLPFPGTIVFCRAYAANYLYSGAVQLWFLYIYRRHDAPWVANAGPVRCGLVGLLGAIAGAGNQHTGPLLFLVAAGVPLVGWRRRREVRWLLVAGAIGVAIGYAYLFFAPGNEVHYDNLAGEASLAQRALSRGLAQNMVIIRDYAVAAAPVVIVMLIALVATRRPDGDAMRAARRGIALALASGLVVALTLFVSPKLGPRFFFLPMALLLAALVGLLAAIDPGRRTRIALAAVGVFASAYFAYATITLYQRLERSSDRRLAELAATPPGGTAVVSPWEIVDTHWLFWGDDFRDPRKRLLVQSYLGTGPIVWFGPNRTASLGVTGIGFAIDLEPPGVDQADVQPTAWERDLPLLARQLESAVRGARGRAAGLSAAQLRVRLPVAPAGLPMRPLLAARWTPAALESFPVPTRYSGAAGGRRTATPPPALAAASWYVWPIGLAAKPVAQTADGLAIELAPGRTHWLIACLPERCFVTSVFR